MSVLVIGEALIDEVHGTDGVARSVGGSPINVAVALGRLGTPVTLLTDLGEDSDGEWIEDHARGSGVLLDGLRTGRTSTATAELQPDGSATYTFDIRWNPQLQRLPVPHTVIHTGSLAIFLDPGARLVAELLQRDPLAIVSLDPNIRPGVIGSHDRAVHRFEAVSALADIVKLSDEDAAWLYPDTPTSDIPDRIAALGPTLVVLTSGAQGAVLNSKGETVRVPSLRVPVADTIGAGDTFMGGLIHHLLATDTSREALSEGLNEEHLNQLGQFAARAAAINVTRHGASPPTTDEMMTFTINDVQHSTTPQ